MYCRIVHITETYKEIYVYTECRKNLRHQL